MDEAQNSAGRPRSHLVKLCRRVALTLTEDLLALPLPLSLRFKYDSLVIRYLRRGRESNPRIEVLQTSALPLGYPAGVRVSIFVRK
jgi:hypothetical protein